MPASMSSVGGASHAREVVAGDRSRFGGPIRAHPVRVFFVITFCVSWAAAFLVALPFLHRGRPLPDLAGILMFPAMLVGPCATGIWMTRTTDGAVGLRALGARLVRWRVGRWYAVLLIPPILVYGVLTFLQHVVSPAFAPNVFVMGILFGIPAGYLEEIGWTGFAFHKMRERRSAFRAAVMLGIAWATWHLPVVDFLGAAYPHGSYWLPFFLAFGTAMVAVRVLICWVYVNTGSILAAQLLHMASTGALVVFSAPAVDPRQEAGWYGVYACALWVVVAAVVRAHGTALERAK